MRLPKAVTKSAADQTVEYLLAEHPEALPGLGRQAFLVDGSSLTLAHTTELLEVYPAPSYERGETRWPVMRVVAAHDVVSGVALQQTDQWVDWKPSRWERTHHPHLPSDACIRVRLIATRVVRKGKVIQLYLVATLDLAVEQMVELHGLRWNIELDLRSLKQTVHLHSLRARTPDMAEKEPVLAVTAYNFIRAAICAAAREAQMDPRRISFSRAQDVVNACLPNLQAATTERQYAVELPRMLRRIAQCKLPQTSHRPSYPRAIWPRANAAFPRHNPDRPKAQEPGSSHA
jgi:hypothetical protein